MKNCQVSCWSKALQSEKLWMQAKRADFLKLPAHNTAICIGIHFHKSDGLISGTKKFNLCLLNMSYIDYAEHKSCNVYRYLSILWTKWLVNNIFQHSSYTINVLWRKIKCFQFVWFPVCLFVMSKPLVTRIFCGNKHVQQCGHLTHWNLYN
jgi:hypothetical protein